MKLHLPNTISNTLFTLCFLQTFSSALAQDTLRVLFIGNSMTYVHDLPALLTDLAGSNGRTIITAQNTPGGYYLSDHVTDPLSLSLMAQNYDYIVVQEQSAGNIQPVLPSITRPIGIIDSIAKAYCSKILLYATPGYPETHPWSVEPYEDMQAEIIYKYTLAARSVRAACLPTAHAFRDVIRNHPGISDMWVSPTDYHPGIKGQYLHACVLYSVLYNETPLGLPAPSGISISDANMLQQTAWNFTKDSAFQLGYHFLDTLVSGFQTTISGLNVIFEDNSSSYINRIEWDFGDSSGTVVSEPMLFQAFGSVNHSYVDTGCYLVTRRLFWGTCETTQDSAVICINMTSVPELMDTNSVYIYPNPTSDLVFIRSANFKNASVSIRNSSGRLVRKENWIESSQPLDLRFLESGVYILEILSGNKHIHLKLIKT